MIHCYQESDYLSYRDQWIAYKASQQSGAFSSSSSVLQCAIFVHYSPSREERNVLLLLACDNDGKLYLWELGHAPQSRFLLDDDDDDDGGGGGVDKDGFQEEEMKANETFAMASSSSKERLQLRRKRKRDRLANFSKPNHQYKLSNGALFKLEYHAGTLNSSSSQPLLLVAGEEGVLVYDWNQLYTNNRTAAAQIRSALLAHFRPYPLPPPPVRPGNGRHPRHPDQHKEPHNKAVCYPPVLDATMVVSLENEHGKQPPIHIYASVKDDFGCYQWNMETQQLIRTFRIASVGYVSCLQSIPSSQMLLTGDDNGMLSIWDGQQGKLVEQININTAAARSGKSNQRSKSTSNGGGSTKSSSASASTRSILCLTSVHDTWWTVGGQIQNGGGSSGGFLTTLHAPTRSIVASVETRETIQRLAASSSSSSSSSLDSAAQIVSVGNESVVSFWHPATLLNDNKSGGDNDKDREKLVRGKQQSRVVCSSPSCHAVATTTVNGPNGSLSWTAAGGVGGFIDLYCGVQQVIRLSVM